MPGRRGWRGGRGAGRPFAGGAVRRFLEPVLLLLLHQGAGHGYELVNALEPFGLGDMASGPVYRTLRQLEAAGLVRSEWDTQSAGGPARRVYRLTQAGHQYLADWVTYLRETHDMIGHFLEAYDRHMQEGEGDYH
ncbi:MAG TPA: PadR family transcriptional regulator [Anaerolineae bacterium]|nr:PadR family transcriptional regulator [Anaerolineae bacterium]